MAVSLALALLPLTIATVGALDLHRALSARTQLQDALDAAALAGAGAVTAKASPATAGDDERLTEVAARAFQENLGAGRPDFQVTRRAFRFDRDHAGVVVAEAEAEIPTILGQLVMAGQPLRVTARAEVVRGAKNLEAALVLDVTGSMRGQKLTALKSAAKDLVDLLVQDEQTPFYSKVALAPYAATVNLGGLADEARGEARKNCTSYGCARFRFTSASGDPQEFRATTCVTERTEREQYTDAGFRQAPVGFNYAGAANPCLGSQVRPLSSDRAALKASINGYVAEGYTAGHIGLAWGWYALAPGFAGLWPVENRPADYDRDRLLKVVVLMTDGMFNTAYRDGVVAAEDSRQDWNARREQIPGRATNGDAFHQARALCDGIKARGVLVYAVGFDLGSQSAADAAASRALMAHCASSPDHVYLPETGADLKAAFHQIGEEISALRLSR